MDICVFMDFCLASFCKVFSTECFGLYKQGHSFFQVLLSRVCCMLRQPRARLTADPTVSVGDLAAPLDKFAAEEQEPNIHKLLSPPSTASWKSGCPTSWLASLKPLFQSYVEVAPNTVISSKKHRQAVVRLLENKKVVNTTRKNSEDFCRHHR